MEFSNAKNVAVIATQSNDQRLMTKLLLKAGYNVSVFNSSDSLDSDSAEYCAIVFCHRRNQLTPQPGLPTCKGSQRVIIFSDCTLEQTVVQALEGGAHHVFDITESPVLLQARLQAALRQHLLQTPRILDVAPFKFNVESHSVYKDGQLVNLSPKEYEFAYYLFAHRHRVVVNAELMTSVWSLPSNMDARRIDTAACRVRKKLQLRAPSSDWSLRRIRRVGYELVWRNETQRNCVKQLDGMNLMPKYYQLAASA